ncbi:Putative ribonuclease H protein At1g65750 [Linum perenne]
MNHSCRKVDIAWEPGPPDLAVLNTDCSVLPNSSTAAVGGLIREALGHCSHAFTFNLGRCSITRAKLRRIIMGLDVAWEVGIRQVAVQVDSRVMIK